jgi:hypothetical protein
MKPLVSILIPAYNAEKLIGGQDRGRRAQILLPRFKWSVLRSLDRVLSRLENRKVPTLQAALHTSLPLAYSEKPESQLGHRLEFLNKSR